MDSSTKPPRKQRDLDIVAVLWVKGLELDHTLKMVMFALATESNRHENHSCYPGQDRIANIAAMSDRTVRRAIPKLVELGLIKVEERRVGGHRTSDRYTLLLPDSVSSSQPDTESKPTGHSVQKSPSLPDTVSYKGKNSLKEEGKNSKKGGSPPPG